MDRFVVSVDFFNHLIFPRPLNKSVQEYSYEQKATKFRYFSITSLESTFLLGDNFFEEGTSNIASNIVLTDIQQHEERKDGPNPFDIVVLGPAYLVKIGASSGIIINVPLVSSSLSQDVLLHLPPSQYGLGFIMHFQMWQMRSLQMSTLEDNMNGASLFLQFASKSSLMSSYVDYFPYFNCLIL